MGVRAGTHHVHSSTIDELLCCESSEAIHKLLLVHQKFLQAIAQGATACNTALVQFIQLLDHFIEETVVITTCYDYYCRGRANDFLTSLCVERINELIDTD